MSLVPKGPVGMHVTKIDELANGDYIATCVCGWLSLPRDERPIVAIAAKYHREHAEVKAL